MNRNESRYFNTARKMDAAFLELLEKKDYAYITVKEICAHAGVNRSTFYLHYETMDDLLTESVESLNAHFNAHMQRDAAAFAPRFQDCPFDELYLITPKYLMPYLEYIREHKRLFWTVVKNTRVLRLEETYDSLFDFVFTPILERYRVPEKDRVYIMRFYLSGLMAIFKEWLKADCEEPIENIIGIIQQCIMQSRGNAEMA